MIYNTEELKEAIRLNGGIIYLLILGVRDSDIMDSEVAEEWYEMQWSFDALEKSAARINKLLGLFR